jgi:hypothetical protein
VFVPLSTSTTVSAGFVVGAAALPDGFEWVLEWCVAWEPTVVVAELVAAFLAPEDPPTDFAIKTAAPRISKPPRISATGLEDERLRAPRRSAALLWRAGGAPPRPGTAPLGGASAGSTTVLDAGAAERRAADGASGAGGRGGLGGRAPAPTAAPATVAATAACSGPFPVAAPSSGGVYPEEAAAEVAPDTLRLAAGAPVEAAAVAGLAAVGATVGGTAAAGLADGWAADAAAVAGR